MKNILTLSSLILLLTSGISQTFSIETSQPIVKSVGKPVLFMKNGSTVFAYDDNSAKKLTVKIFDKNKKLIADKVLNFTQIEFEKRHYAKMVNTISISNWSEINGKIILWVNDEEYEHKGANFGLYKVTINETNGTIEKEEGLGANMIDREMDNVLHYVNPVTQDYCVITQLRKKGDIMWDYTITYFTADGKQAKQFPFASFEPLTKKVKVFILDAKFTPKGELFIVYNSIEKSGMGKQRISCSKIDLKNGKCTSKELFAVSDDANYQAGQLSMVANSNIANILFYAKSGEKSGKIFYDLIYQNFDFDKMEAYKPFNVSDDKLNEFCKSKCGLSSGFGSGFIYSTDIDKNGNLFITRVKNVTSIEGGVVKTINHELIGVCSYDINGKELNAWAYPYNNGGSAGRTSGLLATSIKSDFGFVNLTTKKGNYLIINNLQKNFTKSLNEKPDFARITDECNAMLIGFSDSGDITKEYLFGQPTGKNNKYADLPTALYDATNNMLVVVYYEGEGYKNNRIAWVKLD